MAFVNMEMPETMVAYKILGIHKMELLDLYGKNDLEYFDMTQDEPYKDIETFKQLVGDKEV